MSERERHVEYGVYLENAKWRVLLAVNISSVIEIVTVTRHKIQDAVAIFVQTMTGVAQLD